MTDVLGYPLSEAEAILSSEGYAVRATETRSKKGAPPVSQMRVVRVKAENGVAYLTCAAFLTTLIEEPNEM